MAEHDSEWQMKVGSQLIYPQAVSRVPWQGHSYNCQTEQEGNSLHWTIEICHLYVNRMRDSNNPYSVITT